MSLPIQGAPAISIGISGSTYYATTNDGKTLDSDTDIGALLNTIQSSIVDGDVISFQNGTYAGSTVYNNTNKKFVKYAGNGAIISACKFKIGLPDQLSTSGTRACIIDHFQFDGATAGIIVDNTFNCDIRNVNVFNSDEGISIESSGSWSEFVCLHNVHFNNNKKSLVFKTPTGTGTGSYINSFIDTATFNSTGVYDPGQATYTFIEVQEGAQVNESKWHNMRLWFNSSHAQGIGIEHSGDASRCQLFKPYFENFGSAENTIGIRINSAADSGFFFVDRPVFAGNGTWAGKFINNSNKWLTSDITTWRKTQPIASVGTSASYGSSTTIIDTQTVAATVSGCPQMYIFTSGIRADEKITVEITVNSYSALSFAVTKVVQGSGFWPVSFVDYTTIAANNFYYIIDTITARAHTNKADTSGISVQVGAMQGGTAVPRPSIEDFRTLNSGDQHYTAYRPNNNVGTGCGYFFNMNNASDLEKTYARIYSIVDTNTAGSHAGRLRFDCANAGALAERFAIEKDGALTTKSYMDFTKISAPADPGAEVGRLYFKEKDANNNGLFVKLQVGGTIVEKEIAFV